MANTIDLNVSPYFDDYDPKKDYVKILFKADSGAVQTRELIQLQTMLQTQIERFGDNIFQQGTIIDGCNVSLHSEFPYVKVLDVETDGTPVNVSSYEGLHVKNSNGLVGYVSKTAAGYEATSPDLNTLFVKYINSGNDGNTFTFSSEEVLTIYDINDKIFKYKVNNGSSNFSNNDVVVVTSAITLANSSGGSAFAPGKFNVNDVINNGVANAIIIEANTTANTDYMVLKIKPKAADLISANTLLWKFSSGETIVNLNTSETASINGIIGSGAQASLTTDNLGKIVNINVINSGSGYYVPPHTSVAVTSVGSAVANNDINQLSIDAQNFLTNVSVANTSHNPIGSGYAASISEGVIYQKGYFARVNPHTLIINKYANTGFNKSVGFYTAEEIINSNQDPSLLDNATGAPNYTAPGADRLKLTPSLIVLARDEAGANSEFLPILEFADGLPYKNVKKTMYNVIGDEIAKQRFEESGNYVLDEFNVTTRDNQTFTSTKDVFDVVVDPGQAYINGFKIETDTNYSVAVPKGTTVINNEDATIRVGYGNYINVNELAGIFKFNYGDVVEFYDTARGFVTASNFSSISTTGNKIGTARIRSLLLDSGEPGAASAVYRMYLFDISMSSGKNFADIKSVFYDGTNKGIADIVLEAGRANLKDVSETALLFKSATAVKNADSVSYTYRTQNENLTSNTSGYITIAPPGGSEYFPYGTGQLGTIAERDFVITSLGNYRSNTAATGNVTSNTGSNVITGSGTNFVSYFRAGDFINIANGEVRQIASIANNTQLTLTSNAAYSNTGSAYIHFPYGTAVSVTSRDDRTITMQSNGQITINLNTGVANGTSGAAMSGTFAVAYNVTANNVTPSAKSIKRNVFTRIAVANNAGGIAGPWALGVSDAFRLRKVYKKVNGLSNTSVTFNSNTSIAGGFISIANNPYGNGDKVKYVANTNAISGLTANTEYYVVSSNTSGFKVSATNGGSPISVAPDSYSQVHTFTGPTLFFGPNYGGVYNVTSDFYIDTNQREDYYDISYLYLTPRVDQLNANDVLLIEYDAFDTTTAGVRTVKSYSIDDSLTLAELSNTYINTAEIPEMYGLNGYYYDIRDQFDFRPVSANTIAHTGDYFANTIINPGEPSDATRFGAYDQKFPVPDTNLTANVSYYVGRTDRLVLDPTQTFTIVSGTAGTEEAPVEPYDSITLQILKVPAYPSYPMVLSPRTIEILDTGVASEQYGKRISTYSISPVEDNDITNRQIMRYTMRDIASLDKRISDLEYYVSFTLAETIAKMRYIPSALDPTSDRFKFGFFVDPFDQYSFSDINHPEFYATIKDGFLMPKQKNLIIEFEPLEGSGIITIPYVEEPVVEQEDSTAPVANTGGETEVVQQVMNISIHNRKNRSGRASTPYVYDDFFYRFSEQSSIATLYNVFDSSITKEGVTAIEISQGNTESGPWKTIKTGPAGEAITESDIKWLIDNKLYTNRASMNLTAKTGPDGNLPAGGWMNGAYKINFNHDPSAGRYYRVRVYYKNSGTSGKNSTMGKIWSVLHYPGEQIVKSAPVTTTPAPVVASYNYKGTLTTQAELKVYGKTSYTLKKSSGAKIYTSDLIYTVGSQKLLITATGLKPNTYHQFYFPSSDPDKYKVEIITGSGPDVVGGIKTDASGNAKFYFYFALPSNTISKLSIEGHLRDTSWQYGDITFKMYSAGSEATGTININRIITY